MKYTIEVNDFWLDEEELEEGLTAHIKRSVVVQIYEKIKDQVEKEITTKVNTAIEEKLSLTIDESLSDLINTGVIIKNGKEISIKENIQNIFVNNSGWSSPKTHIERIAKKFGEELKLQYNNAFANQIIINMKKQGLLKDEVVQLLLGKD